MERLFFVILANADRIPAGLLAIVRGAFEPEGMAGGVLGIVVLGFRRAAFSNEAGIGSSSIAHAAVKTREPLTQGFVAMLEPLIDTIIVCSITALVIVTAFEPGSIATGEINGVELTSAAFEQVLPWFPSVLSLVVLLFAYSTLITWSYYGLEGLIYLVGPSPSVRWTFNIFYCLCAVIGCTTTLATILEFSDSMIFAMALANLIGLYCLAPGLRRDLKTYWSGIQARKDKIWKNGYDLVGKTAFISGAGSGIGRTIAISLLEAGANVYICDVHPEHLSRFLEEHPSAKGRLADVGISEEVEGRPSQI